MAEDVGLPKSSLQKSIKELLPKEMRMAGDAADLLVQCCNQFVHLISTQANEISDREKRSTISPEHIIRALEELEFGQQYLNAAKAAWDEWKLDSKEHKEHRAVSRKGDSGLTQEQLIELQQKLFQEARAATLSGPLPSLAIEQVAAALPQEQQQQPPSGAGQGTEHEQQQQAKQGPEPVQAAREPGGADEELDDVDVDSEMDA